VACFGLVPFSKLRG